VKDELLERMQAELARWRGRIDALRVKGSLGRMEARDKAEGLRQEFERAYRGARESLGEAARTGGERARALRAGLEAGWDELRRTYDEVRRSQHPDG
jgi:hypothetical protein